MPAMPQFPACRPKFRLRSDTTLANWRPAKQDDIDRTHDHGEQRPPVWLEAFFTGADIAVEVSLKQPIESRAFGISRTVLGLRDVISKRGSMLRSNCMRTESMLAEPARPLYAAIFSTEAAAPEHLDFTIKDFREMKMQPSLDREFTLHSVWLQK